MVKIKVTGAEVLDDVQYVGNVYEAIKYAKGDGSSAYYAQTADDEVTWFNQDYVEEIEDDKPTMATREPDLRTIKMSDIVTDLGINMGDIVCVYAKGLKNYLICNEKYDLVNVDDSYDKTVPNLILGMVNGKYAYEVYSFKHGFTIEKPNQQTK